jgi:L-methionine (R)-S-oxide reductase
MHDGGQNAADRRSPAALVEYVASLLAGERDFIANAANAAAAIYCSLGRVNWAGTYIVRDGGLVLGPFCGRPATVRIALGDGVCGAAALRRETLVVDDVHAFAGHIACDPACPLERLQAVAQAGQRLPNERLLGNVREILERRSLFAVHDAERILPT